MILLKEINAQAQKIRVTHVLGFFLVAIFLAVLGFIFDPRVAPIFLVGTGWWKTLAEQFSFWGDFPTGTLMLGLALGVTGFALKKIPWQRAAAALILSAIFAGIAVNLVRLTAGRPRPGADFVSATTRLGHEPKPLIGFGRTLLDGKMEDGIYGLQKPAMFHGFPSGHAATSIGTATALVIAAPPLGLVVAPLALGVCWSRMALGRHHLSDILVGAWVGIAAGLFFGRAARAKPE